MSEMRLGRRFWALWSAFTATDLGDGLTLVVLSLLAVGETGDARLVALVAAVRVVPFVVLDVPNRRRGAGDPASHPT